MSRFTYRISAIILAICLIFGAAVSVSAEVPYESYTYWSDIGTEDKSVYNRPMYEVTDSYASADLGVSSFTKIRNISVDSQDNIYILDSTSRIVVFDKNLNFLREIGAIGGTETYNEAASVYIHSDDTLYICDSVGARIIHATNTGELIDFITLPESKLIPNDFVFKPIRMVKDQHDYFYVLSEGSFYGALLYSPEGEFINFYGANTVTTSLKTVMSNISDRMFPNNEKKKNAAKVLPFSFVDIDIDDEGFVYTCNGYTKSSDRQGQIRKLSPGAATNVLNSSDVNFVDAKINTTYQSGAMERQNIISIEIDSRGFIYALEATYGKVFMYDSDCNHITIFGGGMGVGTQSGSFIKPSGMVLLGDGEKVLVVDDTTNLLTVFKITDFGTKVKELIILTQKGYYSDIKEGWEEILSLDNNFQPAYAGLAKVYLGEKEYSKAMEMAKKGYDRETYSVAFEYQRKNIIYDNFTWIFLGIIAIVGIVIAWSIIKKKKNIVLIKNTEVRLMLGTPLHPVINFADIKEKSLGSIGLSMIILAVFYVSTVLQTLAGGFLFTVYDPATFNSIWVLVRSVGLVVLWIVANWLVCTLLGGKGKLREITVVTCYSLIPLIAKNFLRLILTNVLTTPEASFLGILDTIAILYFGLLLIIGLLKIHDFSMSRLIGTSTLSVLGMAAIVFLAIMVIILIQQFWGFILTVGTEIISL